MLRLSTSPSRQVFNTLPTRRGFLKTGIAHSTYCIHINFRVSRFGQAEFCRRRPWDVTYMHHGFQGSSFHSHRWQSVPSHAPCLSFSQLGWRDGYVWDSLGYPNRIRSYSSKPLPSNLVACSGFWSSFCLGLGEVATRAADLQQLFCFISRRFLESKTLRSSLRQGPSWPQCWAR